MQAFYTIGFYNTENLFDTFNDPKKFDDDFTPKGRKKWTPKRFENKIGKLAKTISLIGRKESGFPPVILGLAEVENAYVIKELLKISHLKDFPYGFIHHDSLDERGIDVALIYNKKIFRVKHWEPIHPPVIVRGDVQDFTRDALYVKGKIKNTVLHIFTLHLPSQRNDNVNQPLRESIAQMLRTRINNILSQDENANIIIMGDFNDNPDSETLKRYFKTKSHKLGLDSHSFYNPMEVLAKNGRFTNLHRKNWLLYDQMLFSENFLDKTEKPELIKTEIFNAYFLQEWKRKYKSQPFRTYVGRKYLGGYSDHFPVYSILKF